MDVVIPYKKAHDDFELRYAIRSLVNVTHDRVIVAGDKPDIPGVVHVPVARNANRYASSTANILAACAAGVSSRFIVMHDDIFVLRPWKFRHEDRGTIDEYLRSSSAAGQYRAQTRATRDILIAKGVERPLFFGLHTPTVYERDKLVALIEEYAGHAYLLRTLYHNLHPQPSVRRDDVKLHRWSKPPRSQDVVSISDSVALDRAFCRWIDERFPEPSPYER
ncbi:hypothetical protein NM680_10665 [Paracoccus sp. PS-1]|uniref:hypothetical protein n=1 Tax=Paracoccus sp. PS1 TaxID=2963938 RepID=UPI0027E59DC5|nr:hypothetical protein [Paracoccus sp. PS1]MDQ7262255.1 hypothetical protein [Paracoccus sp. PS1]